MKVLSAFLAKVLLWAGSFIHNADTTAVLPDLADVALNEEAAEIVAFQ